MSVSGISPVLTSITSLTISRKQPPFFFQMVEIEEDEEASAHYDNRGNWIPSTDAGANRRVSGGVSGMYWFCDGERIYRVDSPPQGSLGYKRFSVYYGGGYGFWVLKGDALNPSDEATWHPLRFEHSPINYSSYLTPAGTESILRVQRTDQQWPRMLLPDIYHTSVRSETSSYGGLTGELPIFLALIAFSTSKDWLPNVLPIVFVGGAWTTHEYQLPRMFTIPCL